MNWDAISAVSQLVGSIAVVLSVLYLAVQVHRSTRVAKLATQDAAATVWNKRGGKWLAVLHTFVKTQ